jgi:hypothetical protein
LRWQTVWKTIAWKPPEFSTDKIQQEIVEEQDSKAANEL